jgi:hypothetical protein
MVGRMEQSATFDQAAAWALFHGDIGRCVRALSASGGKFILNNHFPVFSDERIKLSYLLFNLIFQMSE